MASLCWMCWRTGGAAGVLTWRTPATILPRCTCCSWARHGITITTTTRAARGWDFSRVRWTLRTTRCACCGCLELCGTCASQTHGYWKSTVWKTWLPPIWPSGRGLAGCQPIWLQPFDCRNSFTPAPLEAFNRQKKPGQPRHGTGRTGKKALNCARCKHLATALAIVPARTVFVGSIRPDSTHPEEPAPARPPKPDGKPRSRGVGNFPRFARISRKPGERLARLRRALRTNQPIGLVRLLKGTWQAAPWTGSQIHGLVNDRACSPCVRMGFVGLLLPILYYSVQKNRSSRG